MRLLDARGRLLGRVNVVDAAAFGFVAIAIGGGAAGYAAVRPRPPLVDAVTPRTIAAGTPARLLLTGRNLRPFLQVLVAPADTPPSQDPMRAERIGIGDPATADLPVPALGPGTYDIHVYDRGREVIVCRAAFAVAPRPAGGS